MKKEGLCECDFPAGGGGVREFEFVSDRSRALREEKPLCWDIHLALWRELVIEYVDLIMTGYVEI